MSSDEMRQIERLESWRRWRKRRAERVVAQMWPLLQQVEEANKAWLLAEVGSHGGEIAHALAHRMPWRDIVGFEEDAFLLHEADRAARSPATPRLDYIRCRVRRPDPVLSIHTGYASGLVAVGALSFAAEPERLLAEMLRILRPNGSIILGEPVGGRWWGIARDVRVAPERVEGWIGSLNEAGFKEIARRTKSGLLLAGLKRG